MTESINEQTGMPQPRRPIRRDAQRYDVLREAEQQAARAVAVVPVPENQELFTLTITATSNKGGAMDNEQDGSQFLIDLVLKPNGKGLNFRPTETQLILAHIGEILKQVEEEENSLSSSSLMGE